jgi:hypothetical protein
MYILNPIIESDSIGPIRYRNMVDSYGLDEIKDRYPEVRRLLQVFGTEVGRTMFGENFWVDLTLNDMNSFHTVISDVRFKNEADEIRKRGGVVWRVERVQQELVNPHASEIDLDDYDFDLVIKNSSTIKDLHKLVDMAISK